MTERRSRLKPSRRPKPLPRPPFEGFPVGAAVAGGALTVLMGTAYFLLPNTLPLGRFLLVAGASVGLAAATFLAATSAAAHRADLLSRRRRVAEHHKDIFQEKHEDPLATRVSLFGDGRIRALGVLTVSLAMALWWLSPWAPVRTSPRMLNDLTAPLEESLLAAPLVMPNCHLAVLQPPSVPPRVREAASRIDASWASNYDKALRAVVEQRHADARRLLAASEKTALDEEARNVRLLAALNEVYAGQFAEAVGWYAKLIQGEPGDRIARCQMAAATLYAGQLENAGYLIEQGIRTCELLPEDDSEGRLALAVYFHLQATRAALLSKQSDHAEAQCVRAREILAKVVGEDNPLFSASLNNQAVLYMRRGNFAGAENLIDRTREVWRRTLGSNHPLTWTATQNLAILRYRAARYADAAELLRPREENTNDYTRTSVGFALRCHLRSVALRRLARYDQARQLCDNARGIAERALGTDHPTVAAIAENEARLDMAEAYYVRADAGFRGVAEILKETVGMRHPATLANWNHLADLALRRDTDHHDQAADFCRQVLQTPEEMLAADHPVRAAAMVLSGRLESLAGRPREARRLFEEAFGVQQAVFGEEHPVVAATLGELAALETGSRSYHEGVKRYERAIEITANRVGAEHPDVARLRVGLATLYAKQKQWTSAAKLLQQALDVQQKVLPAHHPDLAATLDSLAETVRHTTPHQTKQVEQILARAQQIRAWHAELDVPPR